MAGGSKSKTKGSTAERELCKILSDTLGGSFIRSSNSGAFVGGFNAARKAGLSRTQILGQKGDIIPPDTVPNLVIESKHYKDFSYHLLLSDSNALLDGRIKQALEAKDDSDFWFIAFKANRRSWCVCFDATHAPKFQFRSYCCYRDKQGRRFVIAQLDDFLADNKDALLVVGRDGV